MKKMPNRLWAMAMALVMVMGLMAPQAFAEKIISSGKCGENLKFSIENNTLTVSGKDTSGWSSLKSVKIKK